MNRLKTRLGELILDNPVIPASGTFGFGYEFAQFYDINILGSISIKGTTKEDRFGNETPRIAECDSGLLNAVGLQNPGVIKVRDVELVRLAKKYNKPVIANVSGFSVEEYQYSCEILSECPNVGIIELNISCPNVKEGGMSFGTDPKMAAHVTSEVKKVCKKPLYVKLSPNVTSITSIAKAVCDAGADGLSLINTLLGMRIDIKTGKPILKNKTGGLSGPAIKPVALRMVYEVYEAVKVSIIGMGGISSAEDVLEMMYAGASAVQVGAANLVDPYACQKIINDLSPLLDRLKIEKIEDIIGRAHR